MRSYLRLIAESGKSVGPKVECVGRLRATDWGYSEFDLEFEKAVIKVKQKWGSVIGYRLVAEEGTEVAYWRLSGVAKPGDLVVLTPTKAVKW